MVSKKKLIIVIAIVVVAIVTVSIAIGNGGNTTKSVKTSSITATNDLRTYLNLDISYVKTLMPKSVTPITKTGNPISFDKCVLFGKSGQMIFSLKGTKIVRVEFLYEQVKNESSAEKTFNELNKNVMGLYKVTKPVTPVFVPLDGKSNVDNQPKGASFKDAFNCKYQEQCIYQQTEDELKNKNKDEVHTYAIVSAEGFKDYGCIVKEMVGIIGTEPDADTVDSD